MTAAAKSGCSLQKLTLAFRCAGARSVALVGEFNDWNESTHPLEYDPDLDVWTITVELPPGRYEYKFLVNDREWWNDQSAPKVPNVWGSENSYLEITQSLVSTLQY
jgi:1,4-alpha-glucan branching enzyme